MSESNEYFEEENQTKKSRRIGRWLVVVSLLLFLAGGYLVCFYVPPLEISEKTTYITEPITATGQVDYFRYFEENFYLKDIATDENGYRIFVRTFGDPENYDKSPDADFYREQKYRKLDLDIKTPPVMQLPGEPIDTLNKHFAKSGQTVPDKYYREFDKPWTLDDAPELVDWIKEIDVPLDALAEMVRKPCFISPLLQDRESMETGKSQTMLSNFNDMQFYRSLARRFSARANYRIAQGNIDGAIDDILSIHHLARRMEQHGFLIHFLVAVAIESVAESIPFAGNPERQPTLAELKKFQRELDALPKRKDLNSIYQAERFYILNALQSVYPSKLSVDEWAAGLGSKWLGWKSMRSNPNVVFRYVNSVYDAMIENRQHDVDALVNPPPMSYVDIAFHWLTPNGRAELFARDFVNLLGTNILSRFENMVHRYDCQINLKRLIIALLSYKAEHGNFPDEDWVEKIKPYLGEHWEQCLRCPACGSEDAGTTYALLKADARKDLDTFLLVELHRPVSYDKAAVSVEDVLNMKPPIGNSHSGNMNVACQNGKVFSCNPNNAHGKSFSEYVIGSPETIETTENTNYQGE